MPIIQSLKLDHFKNYSQAKIEFCQEVNCFIGANGAGKTNLLDALYYLSFTKSFFGTQDQQHIEQNAGDYFYIEGILVQADITETVTIGVQKGSKKQVKVNQNEHAKLSDHIGLYPSIMIAPNDILLILEGSEERRKFLDGFIAQLDKRYLHHLLAYNRILDQRNKQLKLFAEHRYLDAPLLDTYNEQLIEHGTYLFLKRRDFLATFTPLFDHYYTIISHSAETVSIRYESDLLSQTFPDLLHSQQQLDLNAQRTTKGIHKDDLDFELNGLSIKKFGSQGQQKSFIIALKLAQYEYLKLQKMVKPLLLLDDIFEKLDEQRLSTLLQLIEKGHFGQLFITDTHLDRVRAIFEKMPQVNVKYFNVEKGNVTEI